LTRRLGVSQSQCGEEKNVLPLLIIRPQFLCHSAHSLVTIHLTALSSCEISAGNWDLVMCASFLVICFLYSRLSIWNIISEHEGS